MLCSKLFTGKASKIVYCQSVTGNENIASAVIRAPAALDTGRHEAK